MRRRDCRSGAAGKKQGFVSAPASVRSLSRAPEDYDAILSAMHARRLELICANPISWSRTAADCFIAPARSRNVMRRGRQGHPGRQPCSPIYARALDLARGLAIPSSTVQGSS